MNKETIRQALTYPGLTEKEVDVYLASLEIRKPTPFAISKRAGLPRPSVYRILESLVEKGIVGKAKDGKKTIYLPEDPKAIVHRLKLQTSTIQNVMPDLRELAMMYRNRPTMRFFEGREGMKRICDDILQTKEKDLLAFSSIDDLFKTLPDYFPAFVKRRLRKGVRVRAISPKSKKAAERKDIGAKEKREIRFIPDNLYSSLQPFHGHIFIYADRIAYMSFDSDQNSIIIENQALADVQRALFELAWISAV